MKHRWQTVSKSPQNGNHGSDYQENLEERTGRMEVVSIVYVVLLNVVLNSIV